MKVIKQSASVLVPESPMKHIERIGRICYKSEDKTGDGTDRKFVKMLYDHGHHAMLEHYRFIMMIPREMFDDLSRIAPRHFEFSSYNDRFIISFNARALMNLTDACRGKMFGYLPSAINLIKEELIKNIIIKYDCNELFGWSRNWLPDPYDTDIKFIKNSPSVMSEEEWKIHGWASVHMITDRGITHEIVRHREETSFAQESTRYCNYSKDKFGNEITVIDQGFMGNEYYMWEEVMSVSEKMYNNLTIKLGVKPEMARSVLPTCLKTEIVMTAPMYEWEHFINLRMLGTAGNPHPMIRNLSTMVFTSMKETFYNENKN